MLNKRMSTYCPVCKDVFLGVRDVSTTFEGHCDECRATYTWKPNATKPQPLMDKDIPKSCGCGRCGR